MKSELTIIKHRSDCEGVIYEISAESQDIRVDFYLNECDHDFYALFYRNGMLYFPEDNLFHAKTWEILRQHIRITLRDADFIYFIGFLNRRRIEMILDLVELKIKMLMKQKSEIQVQSINI